LAATKVPQNPNALPDRFEKMIQVKEDRPPLNLLWRQMRVVGILGIQDASPAKLLELGVWRALLRTPTEDVAATTFWAYMIKARKTLLRHAPDQTDPLRVVTRAWADLPDHIKAALAPIRSAAEASYLRPEDMTPEWLNEIALEGLDKTSVCEALERLPNAIRAAQEEALAAAPVPEFEVWQNFRKIARSRGVDTSRIGIIATPAVQAGLSPVDLDRDWVLRMSADYSNRQRVRLGCVLRELDAMLDDPQLSPLLYATSLGPLPDKRSPGMINLPEGLATELAALHDALTSAASTRREGRAVVRKIANAAVQQGMDITNLNEVLKQVEVLGFEGPTLRKARRMRLHLENKRSSMSGMGLL
jgi:hypothetical protein